MIHAPATEAEVAEAVRAAPGPLELRGGGTRPVGGPVQAAATLDLSRLTGITLYEPGALTLVARAGTRLAEIARALDAEGQMLAFEPPDWRGLLGTAGESTIGGVVATNASGPRRVMAGACRDSLLGVRFVDGTGRVIKNGGRVMKNVTGYDLVKLMAGSYGTLGVLTEVAFRVVPKPGATASVMLFGLAEEAAVAAMAAALGSPFGVSGAAHEPAGPPGGPARPRTLLRVEGTAASVAYRAARLAAHLAPFGPAEIEDDPGDTAGPWQLTRSVAAHCGRPGAVWRLSVRPTTAPGIVAAVRRAVPEATALYDQGGGLVWLRVPEDGDAAAGAIRGAVAGAGGHATLMRAAASVRAAVPVFEPEAPAVAVLSAGLRAKFDPRRILNPGRMG
jgi:glycolate oxidase FAD binding subunit